MSYSTVKSEQAIPDKRIVELDGKLLAIEIKSCRTVENSSAAEIAENRKELISLLTTVLAKDGVFVDGPPGLKFNG